MKFKTNNFPFIIFLIFIISLKLALKSESFFLFSISSFHLNKKIFPRFPTHINPLPPHLAEKNNVLPEHSLYVIVLDEMNSPAHYHCITKKLWMNNFTQNYLVDGVEIYSFAGWYNKECNLTSINIKPPPYKMTDFSSWRLHEALKESLNRTDAGFFFIVGDAAYINTERFFQKFLSVSGRYSGFSNAFASGGCIERRYFFQMFSLSSGIFLSRFMVQKILNLEWKWNVSIEIELPAEESLSQILDTAGQYILYGHIDNMIGAHWLNPEHYSYLKFKKFDKLTKCQVPESYLNPEPGKNGVCSTRINKMNDIIVWAGSINNSFQSKEDFLSNAPDFLDKLPDNIGYYWEKYLPHLCKIQNI